VGVNKFILQADAPDISQIPHEDILGVTVVLVTCSYREKEFVRVGYYVNNEYEYDEPIILCDDEQATLVTTTTTATAAAGPTKKLDMNKVRRIVLADKPRVTRFPIQWGDITEEEEEKEMIGTTAGTAAAALSSTMLGTSNDDEIMVGTVSPEEEDEGMTLDELGTGKEEEEEFEDDDDDDDVSLEGKDMMGDLMMSNVSPMSSAME
jgi:histone chaperone ASF1